MAMSKKMERLLQMMPLSIRQAYYAEWEIQRKLDYDAMAEEDLRYSGAVWNSISIALHRCFGFSEKRIGRVLEMAWNILEECTHYKAAERRNLTDWDRLARMSDEEAHIHTELDDVGGGAYRGGKVRIRFKDHGKG